MHWKENGLMVKIISSTLLQNFLNFEHNPTDATFTLNTVFKLNGLVYEKWNSWNKY